MAGESGIFSIGVDYDYKRLSLVENTRMFDKSPNSGFVLGTVDEQFLEKIPNFDVVLFFSILHHIWRQVGHDAGFRILEKIRSITNKAMFFDTGQSNEVSTTWASKIPDMGSDPKSWLVSYLKSAGFQTVEVVGETDAFRPENRRYLFKCLV